MTSVVANATRCGSWWAVEFDGPTGTFNTQARRLDQIPEMVCDILEMEGVTGATVTINPLLPDDLAQALAEAKRAAAQAQVATDLAARQSREVASQLRASGLTVRDAGELLGVSPQRISQLVNS